MTAQEIVLLITSFITTSATIILACLTYKYVRLTSNMVEQMREARNPLIVIDFKSILNGIHMTKIEIIISNKGLSPAKDLLFKTDDIMFFIREKTDNSGIYENILLTQLPIFNNGIPYLAPGNNIHLFLGEVKNEQLEIAPRIKVYFNYKTETGKFISDDVIFDFRYLAKDDL